jgi:hypothetical protein
MLCMLCDGSPAPRHVTAVHTLPPCRVVTPPTASRLQQPHQEPRCAAYDLLAAVTALPGPWGVRRVWGYPGAAAYLQDRASEDGKAGLEWKFAVTIATVRNPAAASALGAATIAALLKWYAAGPYARQPTEPSVTMMSA